MNRNICPICETGTLSKQVHTGEIQYRDRTIPVPNLEYSQCDSCGADPVLAEQAKHNQARHLSTMRNNIVVAIGISSSGKS